jgi:hypothetical protein
MTFTQPELEEFRDIAERFIGAFVKANQPVSKFTVCGIACDSIEQAVDVAIKKCARPASTRGPPNKDMEEKILRQELAQALKSQEQQFK